MAELWDNWQKNMLNLIIVYKETFEFLNGGMADRNKSSYDYSVVFTEETAEKYICKAERFIDESETLL